MKMPSEISNALGTQRQFTASPVGGYIGNYSQNIISPHAAQAAMSSNVQVAQNIERLTQAFNNYTLSHEQFLSDTGSIEAERYIASKTPEDLKKMNVIDAAQNEGLVDSASNPYFAAYAEKMRGRVLSDVAKQEYDHKYAMDPAKSAADEARRYSSFVNDWEKANLSDVQNKNAFNSGFYEDNLKNISALTTQWERQDHENKIQVVMAESQSQLGSIIENSRELLKENGPATEKTQQVFNQLRLMGLPMQYRQKLLQDFVDQFISTGHIGAERLEQMLDNITIQTDFDGTVTRASDLLNMQTTKTMAAEYNRQFYTQEKYDWVEKYVKMGENGKIESMKDVSIMLKENPEKAVELNAFIPQVFSRIDQNTAKQEVARLQAMAQRGKSISQKVKPLTEDSDFVEGLLNAWNRGDTMYEGLAIAEYSIKDDVLYRAVMPMINHWAQGDDTYNLTRIMDLPQLKKLRETISDDLSSTLSGIMPTDDGGVNIGNNPELEAFVTRVMENPGAIAHTFGGKLAGYAYTLNTLYTAYGMSEWGKQQALRLFAEGNQMLRTHPEVDEQNKTLAKNSIAGYTIDGVSNSAYHNDYSDVVDLGLGVNDYVREDLQNVWHLLLNTGLSNERVMEKINKVVRDNYETYHYGAFPRAITYNMETVNDPYYFRKGIDTYIYDTIGEDDPLRASATTISYNSSKGTFVFNDTIGGNTQSVTLAQIRSAGKYQADLDMKEGIANYNSDNTTNNAQELQNLKDEEERRNKAIFEPLKENAGANYDPFYVDPYAEPQESLLDKLKSTFHSIFG